jgi:hypothetical protein
MKIEVYRDKNRNKLISLYSPEGPLAPSLVIRSPASRILGAWQYYRMRKYPIRRFLVNSGDRLFKLYFLLLPPARSLLSLLRHFNLRYIFPPLISLLFWKFSDSIRAINARKWTPCHFSRQQHQLLVLYSSPPNRCTFQIISALESHKQLLPDSLSQLLNEPVWPTITTFITKRAVTPREWCNDAAGPHSHALNVDDVSSNAIGHCHVANAFAQRLPTAVCSLVRNQ